MNILSSMAATCVALGLSGCVVAPVRPAFVAPAGVVYVAPAYAMPGPGFRWAYHARFGWGWHHPNAGWYRGWR